MDYYDRSLRRIVLLGNLAVLAIMLCLYWLLQYNGTGFALGVMVGSAIYQIAHRARYGQWFD